MWANLTIVAQVDDETKVYKIDGLKELSIPLLNVMGGQMTMGGHKTSKTEYWMAETVKTFVEGLLSSMTGFTDR